MTHEVFETKRCIIHGSDNWDELTPERQQEMREVYAKNAVAAFWRKFEREKLAKSG